MAETRVWNITARTLLWKEMRLFQFWRPQSGCSRASVNPRDHPCSLMSENLCLTFFLMWSHKTIGGILGEMLAATSAQVNSYERSFQNKKGKWGHPCITEALLYLQNLQPLLVVLGHFVTSDQFYVETVSRVPHNIILQRKKQEGGEGLVHAEKITSQTTMWPMQKCTVFRKWLLKVSLRVFLSL